MTKLPTRGHLGHAGLGEGTGAAAPLLSLGGCDETAVLAALKSRETCDGFALANALLRRGCCDETDVATPDAGLGCCDNLANSLSNLSHGLWSKLGWLPHF